MSNILRTLSKICGAPPQFAKTRPITPIRFTNWWQNSASVVSMKTPVHTTAVRCTNANCQVLFHYSSLGHCRPICRWSTGSPCILNANGDWWMSAVSVDHARVCTINRSMILCNRRCIDLIFLQLGHFSSVLKAHGIKLPRKLVWYKEFKIIPICGFVSWNVVSYILSLLLTSTIIFNSI